VIFTGRMDYWPNIDAMQWFAHEVLPVLQRRVHAARLWIVGAAPSPEVRVLGRLPGVQVTGRVADMRPWLAATAHCARHPEQDVGGNGDGEAGRGDA
jgi:hypothetical protein